MTMEYKLHNTTNSYLERVRSHKEPYTTEILGKEIIVYPNVMSHKYDWPPPFYIENMPNQKDKEFLEIGCGSGVLSLFATFQGAKKVVAVDINPNAIENTKANFQKYNLKNFEVFESDVFEKVRGKFDTINFNVGVPARWIGFDSSSFPIPHPSRIRIHRHLLSC